MSLINLRPRLVFIVFVLGFSVPGAHAKPPLDSLLIPLHETRPRVTLILRIKPGARIGKVLEGVPGIFESAKLFRGEEDPDLAFLYILEIRGDSALQVIEALEASPLVEHVEVAPRRRLSGLRRNRSTPGAS